MSISFETLALAKKYADKILSVAMATGGINVDQAETGELLRVKATDDSGNPIKWETVELQMNVQDEGLVIGFSKGGE